jgi:hypothetical protein
MAKGIKRQLDSLPMPEGILKIWPVQSNDYFI